MPLLLWSSPCFVGRVLIENLGQAVGRRALVHVDARGPVDLRIVLLGHQQFAGAAVERVAEPVAVEMGQELALGAADLLVAEDHFVDAVIVPFIMGVI